MEIKGKVHCFFEQSGTFKNAFIGLGIPAEDYDIQDNFGETDHVIDLFAEIDRAYDGGASVFDGIGKDDLVVAFYPCIYFCDRSTYHFHLDNMNYRKLTVAQKIVKILERSKVRTEFYDRLVKFVAVILQRGIRMIFENPWTGQHYLKNGNFLKPPSVVDEDRTRRGDIFRKPTAYWFWNCEPTHGNTYQPTDDSKIMIVDDAHSSGKAGICSAERSMITHDYARNFIHDFILGKPQAIGQLSLPLEA